MNTTVLRYIVEFAAYGYSQKAADNLGVSRSSITRSIKKLEDELGTQLFIMTPDGAVPTCAGDICLRYARHILRINGDLRFDLSSDGIKSGNINIGMDVNRSPRVLPYALPAFHKAYPNIQVHLHELNTPEREAALINRQLDFAIMSPPITSPNIDFEQLMTEDFVFVAPKDDPFAKSYGYTKDGKSFISLEKFREQPFILSYNNQKSRTICNNIFKKAGFEPNILFQTRSSLNAAMLAWNGFAYTLVPESNTIINCKSYIDFFNLEPDYNAKWIIGIAALKGEKLSHAAEQLKSEIFKALGDKTCMGNKEK